MVQRKGTLPVADSRSSGQGPGRSGLLRAWSGVPLSLQPWGDLPPYLADGARGGEPELVSLSQTCQGTKFSAGQAPTRAGQSYCKGQGHWKNESPK